MRTRTTLIALTATALLLGACHKQQTPPTTDNQAEAPAPVEQAQAPALDTAPPAPPAPVVPKAKAAPKPTADQQMLDDADATGMTSHTASSDDGGAGTTGNGQQ